MRKKLLAVLSALMLCVVLALPASAAVPVGTPNPVPAAPGPRPTMPN